MTRSDTFISGGKTHTDENFPVASYIIGKEHRGAVLAFYRFARAADDIADHIRLSEQEKIARLDQFEATLLGMSDAVAEALPLRTELSRRRLSPRHALDLLVAFRQDAVKARYATWDELLHYCMYSAAPVGRFVLDVHGEDASTWRRSDALCSMLQIINHLQDCKADYQALNRVYIPQDSFAHHGAAEADLAAETASPALRACIRELADRTKQLFPASPLSMHVRNTRLGLEVLIIETLAGRLLRVLDTRDPLSQSVHLNKLQFISVMAGSIFAMVRTKIFHRENP